jgi:putative ABC transport system permease protein
VGGVVHAWRLSLRSLLRSPGFTVPALLILAVGMTAVTAVFTVVDSIVFEPLAYPESGRVVMICEDHPSLRGACVASPGNVTDLGAGSSTLETLGFGRGWSYSLSDGAGVVGVRGGLADGSFFRALGVTPPLGRLFSDDEYGPDGGAVVLLSHAIWSQRYGGDPAVLGSMVRLDGEPYTVVGVLPEGFEAPLDLEGIQLWTTPHFRPLDPEVRGWRGFRAVGRLAPGATLAEVREEATARYASLAGQHEEIDGTWRIRVRPVLDVVVGNARPVLLLFLAAAGLVLLIVCANVANLLLARGMVRRHELAVRAALGAGRGRLVRLILGESLVLTVVATGIALLLSIGLVGLIVRVAPPGIPRLEDVALNTRVLSAVALLAVIATSAFAILPAFSVTRWNLSAAVRTGGRDRGGRPAAARLRNGLVVIELAFSVVLLSTAALLTRSFSEYLAWDPGFDTGPLLTVSVFASTGRYASRADLLPLYREMRSAVEAVPGVAAASTASAGPLFGGGDGAVGVLTERMDDAAEPLSAWWFDVGPGYFEALGLPMTAGREFNERDVMGAPPVALINESFARLAFGEADPLGQRLRLPERELALEVVGVVPDVPSLTPGAATLPQLFWPDRQFGRWGTHMVIRASSDPSGLATSVTDALLRVDPELSLGTPRLLSDAADRALVRPRFEALVLGLFALVALVLSAAGVYAVMSYLVTRRIREMGIRIALGAGRTDVVTLILRASAGVAALGAGLGLLGVLAIRRVLSGVIHGVSPTDPMTLVGAVTLLMAIVAVASLLPARRAGRANPLDAIRAE